MKFINLTILSLVISLICLSVCEASNHEKNSKTQLSTLKEKNNMQPSSPMLNEIFCLWKIYRRREGKRCYLYCLRIFTELVLLKKRFINKLSDMNQHYTDEGKCYLCRLWQAGSSNDSLSSVSIVLKFNNLGYLEDIDSKFHYAQ